MYSFTEIIQLPFRARCIQCVDDKDTGSIKATTQTELVYLWGPFVGICIRTDIMRLHRVPCTDFHNVWMLV